MYAGVWETIGEPVNLPLITLESGGAPPTSQGRALRLGTWLKLSRFYGVLGRVVVRRPRGVCVRRALGLSPAGCKPIRIAVTQRLLGSAWIVRFSVVIT